MRIRIARCTTEVASFENGNVTLDSGELSGEKANKITTHDVCNIEIYTRRRIINLKLGKHL